MATGRASLQTTIRFLIPPDAVVRAEIFDAAGRHVRKLLDGSRNMGVHELQWDGRDDNGDAVASGIYLFRLSTGQDVTAARIIRVH